jgi:hypothetical protein
MKKLITHYRPHLDDICGIWLLRRFVPEFATAEIDFISTGPTGNPSIDTNDIVHVGVGRGKFDEHKGDLDDCATSLIFKFIRQTINLEKETEQALKKIVAWVLLEDTGLLATVEQRDFTLPIILKGEYDRSGRDSVAVVDLGLRMLDALLPAQLNIVKLENDWLKRVEFESCFGPAVALQSDATNVDAYAYRQGIPLVVSINKTGRYHSIRANAKTDIELTSIFKKLQQLEPDVSWYLHHGKQMIICGGDLSPEARPSALTLRQLMELLK